MQNIITINADDGTSALAIVNGADEVVVQIKGAGASCRLEVYKGNEFYNLIDCEVSEGTATATLPAEIFTGSIIHFRVSQGGSDTTYQDLQAYTYEELQAYTYAELSSMGGYNQFYHLLYDTERTFIFSKNNNVVFTNSAA
jgi:hypothetical protein